MDFDQHNYSVEDYSETESNLKDIISHYIMHWKWFILSIVLCLLAGFLYLKYTVPQYEVNASILIKDDKKGGALSELSAFEDLGMLKGNSNIDNEIEILKSRTLMEGVIRELRLNISYFVVKYPVDDECYENSPVVLNTLSGDSTLQNVNTNLTIYIKSDKEFELLDEEQESKGLYAFNQTIQLPFGKIVISDHKQFIASAINKKVKIVITPVRALVDAYRGRIQINPVNKSSNVITISLKDAVKEKAIAIVNNLIEQHNADAIEDKNQVSKNTAQFINDRIQFITSELTDVESSAEEFKTKHKLVDVVSEAGLFLNSGTLTETSIIETATQVRIAEYMANYLLEHNTPADLIPSNLGLEDASVSTVIASYNTLVLERNRILKNSSEKNPVVMNLDAQILNLRKSLQESLQNYKESLRIKLAELNKQENGINTKIAAVPKYEREYRVIQRQQQIKEALYLYLLQKREETNIALAVTVANAKVIDKAYSNGSTVSPKRQLIYLVSFLLGIVIPVVILYVLTLLDTKIHGKKDIDALRLPFLGDIPETEAKDKLIVTKGDSSSVSEAFRLLRTNLDFMMSDVTEKGKTIFVTSTVSKEGKSFIALNLSSAIALSGKKVLLIGMDLRAPKLLEYLNLKQKTGLTNYLMSHDLKIEDIIFSTGSEYGFDVMPSGDIPPNPSELLMNPKVKTLFDSLKESYDYIVVDTAPVGMVTDTLLLSKYAHCFVFVARANYLDKRLLSVAETIYKEKRLPNMAVLINGSDHTKGYGYGYGYGGYGYGHQKPKSWWKRMIR